jgi:CheY-like chemotaxis protein
VEDDADVRSTVVSNLIDLGYRVLDAENGDHALGMLQQGIEVDLLFTDVVMPGKVSSTQLAAEAKRLQPGIAVLFTSGYIQDALTSGGRLEEGVQLLSKPYKRDQLAAKIRESLRRRAPA